MAENQLSVHPTTAKRIRASQVTGWEFSCDRCDYRARFTYHAMRREPKLEVLDHGDPLTRHTGSPGFSEPLADNAGVDTGSNKEDWLTPELREQLEEILRRADFGD